MCTKAPATVDYETDNRGRYLDELEICLKRFNGALTNTMNSYRDLMTAFDKMGQVFGNLAGDLKPEVKDPIVAMRDGMRDLKDKGAFVTFNSDIHEGTINVLDPLRVDLKKAQKSLEDLKVKQKDYDALRNKIEKKEKEYAKKDKPLKESETYKKDNEKLSKSKMTYESKRESFEREVTNLKTQTGNTLLTSMNNYLHCTATFAGYLEATMNTYRTDMDGEGKTYPGSRSIKMDVLKQEAERRSVTRRNQNSQRRTSGMYPTDNTAAPAINSSEAVRSASRKENSVSHLSHPSANSGRRNSSAASSRSGGEKPYPADEPRNPLISQTEQNN